MPVTIKVMSFNIRYRLASDEENSWEQRKPLVIERIQAFHPDLLGLQECRDDDQRRYIQEKLPDYALIGVHRSNQGETAIEMAPVLYQKSVFREVARGHFWLSETPGVPGSQSWGSVFARTASWVRLQHASSSREIIFLNTHFDYGSALAIEESAKLLHRWAMAARQAHPIVMTGDFNASKDSPAYSILTQENTLTDVYRQVHRPGENEATYHGYGKAGKPAAIDWILASGHFTAVDAAVDRYTSGSRYPSDHFPLTAELLTGEA